MPACGKPEEAKMDSSSRLFRRQPSALSRQLAGRVLSERRLALGKRARFPSCPREPHVSHSGQALATTPLPHHASSNDVMKGLCPYTCFETGAREVHSPCGTSVWTSTRSIPTSRRSTRVERWLRGDKVQTHRWRR